VRIVIHANERGNETYNGLFSLVVVVVVVVVVVGVVGERGVVWGLRLKIK
jgi:hypothetical protein